MMSTSAFGCQASHGHRACSSTTAPDTSGAAREVPDWRVVPPCPSDTRIISPGATMKWVFSGVQAPVAVSMRQASPGRLEKFEMVPSRPTDPTTSRDGFTAKFHGMLVVWVAPSFPAATTSTWPWAEPEARAVFHPASRVWPRTPREAFSTPTGASLPAVPNSRADRASTPLPTSVQLVVRVLS